MIELGSIPLRDMAAVVEARDKVRLVAEALRFDPIVAARLATATSEMGRLMCRAAQEPRLSVGLTTQRRNAGLVLCFEARQPVSETAHLRLFFDDVRVSQAADGYAGLRAVKHFADPGFAPDARCIAAQRQRIQRPSRTELLLELQAKNAELEQHHSRLEATVAERTAQLAKQVLEAQLLHGATEIVVATDSVDEALQNVVDMVCDLTTWPIGHVYGVSPEKAGVLASTSIWHLPDADTYAEFRAVTERTYFALGEGLPGRILQSSEPVWITNVQTDTNFPRNALSRQLSVMGAFGFPVTIAGEIVAVMEFFSDREQPRDEDLLRVMRNVGAQLGRVFERKRAEDELKRAHDATQQTNAELRATLQELRTTQEQLIQSEKMSSLGQLTAGVAHEINNPINFVSSNVTPLKRDVADLLEIVATYDRLIDTHQLHAQFTDVSALKEKLDYPFLLEEIDRLLNGMEEGATRTAEIVRGLRNFSRIDEQEQKLADLHQGLDSTLLLLRNPVKGRIEVVKDWGDLPQTLCHPGQLNQVFLNVLSNASQAIEGQGQIRITTRHDRHNNRLTISFKDTGKGMTEEVKKRLFEPFFTTKEVGSGTGLGLSISFGIIESHGGHIDVHSHVGEGTEFVLTLPVQQ